MKNPLLSCPTNSKKNVNSAKTTLYYGPKKSKRFVCFFTILTKYYCSQDHILSENVQSLKNKLISYSHILSKNVNFLKYRLILYLFILSFKTLCWNAHIWSKRQYCQNYTIICLRREKSTFGGVGVGSWAYVAAFRIKITIYCRNGRFFPKKWAYEHIFLENIRFWTKCGHNSINFFVKNRKKRHHIDFLCQ